MFSSSKFTRPGYTTRLKFSMMLAVCSVTLCSAMNARDIIENETCTEIMSQIGLEKADRDACSQVVSELIRRAEEGIKEKKFTWPKNFIEQYECKVHDDNGTKIVVRPKDYPHILRSRCTSEGILRVPLRWPGSFRSIFQAASKLSKLPKTVPAVRTVQLNDRVSVAGCPQTAKPVPAVQPVQNDRVSVDAQSVNMKIDPDTRSVGTKPRKVKETTCLNCPFLLHLFAPCDDCSGRGKVKFLRIFKTKFCSTCSGLGKRVYCGQCLDSAMGRGEPCTRMRQTPAGAPENPNACQRCNNTGRVPGRRRLSDNNMLWLLDEIRSA